VAFAGAGADVVALLDGAAISAPLRTTARMTPAENIFSTLSLNFTTASIGTVVRAFINQNECARIIPYTLRKFLLGRPRFGGQLLICRFRRHPRLQYLSSIKLNYLTCSQQAQIGLTARVSQPVMCSRR